ncbi:MAG: ACT domain-containing protein [Chloroflexi bacterium]|nr:MAG: ACT domain-containing protein [Chloroflexota bacterium]
MEQTKEFSLTLDDRPGTLAKATDAIAKAGINVEGYCAVPSGNSGKGTFRVVTKDPANTRKALEAAGFKVQDERDAAIIDVEDRSADDFSKLRDTLQELTPARRR